MAFVTAKTVPTVIDIAILAAKAFGTIVFQLVSGAVQTAAILIPVVMVAKPALHTVFPCSHDRSR